MIKLENEQLRLQKIIDDSWLGDAANVEIARTVFTDKNEEFSDDPMKYFLRIMMNPDNFYFTCKHILNIELLPFQLAIIKELWTRKYPILIGTRGLSKSFLLAVYAMLRALLTQGSKVLILGSGFRQSKVLFDYCEKIWYNAPVLRSICGGDKRQGPHRGTDQHTMNIGDSIIIALPIGDGEKIRGQRATHIICDEFKSHNVEIFETVIAGFGAVSSNPVEGVKSAARIAKMKELGLWNENKQAQYDRENFGNQVIISGTAYYEFNHFAKYWKRYKQIIYSKGEKRKLDAIFNNETPVDFNYRDYCVIRIPVELVPRGFMDEKNVALSKATASSGNYNVEYGAVFVKDSDGFYRRTLIETCVAPLTYSSGEIVNFKCTLRGNTHKKYIFSVDPASERDNFSITILELHETHRRIVYCWTTTKKIHRELISKGKVKELDFYSFAARKIRDLMKYFYCERIALDSQGGGIAVAEALHDLDKLETGEKLIWPIIDPEKENWTDNMDGLHIIEMINFADAKWVSEANHGMRKDLEDKVLVFPFFDPLSLAEAHTEDSQLKREYDTLEDCAYEIEELKDELTSIVHTQTGNSQRDHWDTPEIKTAGNKKGRLRKDRYSALLMGNMVARTIYRSIPEPEYKGCGGFATGMSGTKHFGKAMCEGPAWFTNSASSNGGFSVKRV